MNKQTLKILIISSWVLVILMGVALFVFLKPKVLKNDLINANPYLNDKEEYNLSLNTRLQQLNSPLYTCESNKIPSYLDDFASKIDSSLRKTEDENFITWSGNDTAVIIYDIDTTELSINLSEYNDRIEFTSIKSFIANYLDPAIKYWEAKEDGSDEFKIYSVNREIDGRELKTGYGYSDYYQVENGYLTYASILLAKIEKSKFVVPVISDVTILEKYLLNPSYPKDLVLDNSAIIKEDEFTYESANPNF